MGGGESLGCEKPTFPVHIKVSNARIYKSCLLEKSCESGLNLYHFLNGLKWNHIAHNFPSRPNFIHHDQICVPMIFIATR